MGCRKGGGQGPLSFLLQFNESGSSLDITTKREKNVRTVEKYWQPRRSWGCNDVRTFLQAHQFSRHRGVGTLRCQTTLCQCNKPRILATILNVGNLLNMTLFHIRKFCWQRGKQILPFAKAEENSRLIFFWSVLLFCQNFQLMQKYSPKENNCPEKIILRNDAVLFLECLPFHSISNLFWQLSCLLLNI